MPHMIDFTFDYRYAFVANPAGGNTAVLHVADREVIAVLDTGPHLSNETEKYDGALLRLRCAPRSLPRPG